MANGVALGIDGIEANLGDHICGLYSGESQRDRIMIPFLEAGLACRGTNAYASWTERTPTHIVATLNVEAEAEELTAKKQLEGIRAPDMYLRSGGFSADEDTALF